MLVHLRARTGGLLLVLALVLALCVPGASCADEEQCFCQLSGVIDDCCCSIEDVNRLNEHVAPLVTRLAESDFFKYYRVNMDRPCKFWRQELAECGSNRCSVEPCDENEVPERLRALDQDPSAFECVMGDMTELGQLRDTVSADQAEQVAGWHVHTDSYCFQDDENSATLHYVNLVDNPERFTGYSGRSPAQIWKAIYGENCFHLYSHLDNPHLFDRPDDASAKFLTSKVVAGMCMEKRVFYRIVSGLHAAINMHVAAHYPRESILGQESWGPNVTLFERFFHPAKTWGEGPNWLKNIYFNYLLVVRAITKASSLWEAERFYTHNSEQDEEVAAIVKELIDSAPRTCPSTFDESLMFNGPESLELKQEFQTKFQNISLIMDCVECSTCRLWGKLKVHGLAAAMRILFADDSATLVLSRNEVVALFNTLAQFSQAIEEINTFRQLSDSNIMDSEPTLPFA
ncbi:uncharacterized protein MONBRDRAFT_31634 [Monosiga brevicollis MX1]|uniref:Uncharacterized protein n=1 Tax=Monosiga brevicollis TaxID=81824 RepID=A9UUU1_MONBE|nr:uncharacterized protein MONBRDRAFT_31634 [Monosiga brevicollis MX1]EDQ90965.1 predicted protein [Monosiga brevicollis MX1]|eukprot:XP_001744262.1 hypothetical protein [Monosiga brevicollis MX1]